MFFLIIVWVKVWGINHNVKIPIIRISAEKIKFFGHYIYNIYDINFLSRLKCLINCSYIYLYAFLMPFILNENKNNIYVGYVPDNIYIFNVFLYFL